jgi:hypothetical protein
LADFQKLSQYNHGYKYLLLAVDVLSRRFFGSPVKSKQPKDMIAAFEEMFKQLPRDEDGSVRMIKRLYTDRGLEFEAAAIKEYFKSKGIEKLSATSLKKAAVAERGIRTIKGRLYRWFSDTNRLDWTSVLPQFLESINNSRSRATGLPPNQINEHNAREIWKRLYSRYTTSAANQMLKEGDKVRIAEPKQVFDKAYFPTHSDHIYTIAKTHRTKPEYYELVDYAGNKVKRKFYRPELVKTRVDAETTWRIEKVIRERRRGGEKEFLVTFIGYPDEYWIKESDFIN